MDDRFEIHLKNEIGEITERIDTIIKKIDELKPEQEEEKPQAKKLLNETDGDDKEPSQLNTVNG